VEHAAIFPTSGERKKFCDATESGVFVPKMFKFVVGTEASSETHCDCS
jgi:hypothetical protein